MKQPIHILYIPGFNTKLDAFRLWVLRKWRFRNVTVELVPMKWQTGTFEQKIARIDRAIDRAAGKRIVVIGESAGGSMAVHMYARRGGDLYKVMALSGKVSHPETVAESYYDYSPAFRTSMEKLDNSIAELTTEQRRRFVSIHPLYDAVVPVRETLLDGCREVRLPSVGHLVTNVLALTLFAPLVVRVARRS